MKLIAEAGATKIQWGIVDDNKLIEFETSGFNPNVSDRNYLRQLLVTGFPHEFDPEEIRDIQYYGAGCGTQKSKNEVHRALNNFFNKTDKIEIFTDLQAAGRAFFLGNDGYVGVLGTGSSFAYYNDGDIEIKTPSLGYLLGDEGSGAHMGKQWLMNLLQNKVDKGLENIFFNEYNMSRELLIRELYQSKLPNAYLAGFSKFLGIHKQHKVVNDIILDSFVQFVEKYVLPTIGTERKKPIGLVGGVADAFKLEIGQVFDQEGLECPIVLKKPFDLLVKNQ